jgi:hypothetical protein
MSQSPASAHASDALQPRRRKWRAVASGVFCGVLFVGTLVLWAVTSHIDRNGHLPTPAVVFRVPGGFFQAVGMRGGLHLIAMRQQGRRVVAIEFERATYLGNAGYHRGAIASWGGFTFVLLTRTLHDSDLILSPHVAVALPYWFLAAAFGCALLFSVGFFRCPACCTGSSSPAKSEGK